MIAHVHATVIDGALKLDQPVDLPNNSRVAVRVESLPAVETTPPTDEERRAAWERMKRRIEERPVHGGGQRFNRDGLYDRG